MRRIAYAAGALALTLVLIAAALLLFAPAFVDTPAVRAEIQRRLAHALGGQVSWEALELGFFPAPHGALHKVRIEIPGRLSAAADDVNVYLRLWPLLRGDAEVSSITVARPQVRITPAKDPDKAPLDAMSAYRAAMEPAARALQEFAPDMTLRMDDATVEIAPGFALRTLHAAARTDAKGVSLEASAASNFWQRLSLEGRVEYHDLSARAAVALDKIDVAQVLAASRLKGLRLDFIESSQGRVSAKGAFTLGASWLARVELVEADAAVKLAQLPWPLSVRAGQVTLAPESVALAGVNGALGGSSFALAAAQIDLAAPARLSAASGSATLPLEQWLPWLRERLPLDEVTALSGSVEVALHKLALRFDRPAEVDFDAVVTPRKLSATLKALPMPLAVSGGSVRAGAKRVQLENLQGTLGSSTFSALSAQIELGKAPRVASASGRATLQLEPWLPWLQAKAPLDELTSLSGSAELELHRLALAFERPAEADFDGVVTPRKVSAVLKMLPAAVTVESGAIQVGSKALQLKNLGVAMLDARAQVSGAIGIRKPGLELALTEGRAGEKLVRWALGRAAAPERFEPRTPLGFAARRIAWAPQGALEADARIDFEGGPEVGLALAWRPELLELRRVAIKDARSDAVLGAAVAGELIQASFAGKLDDRSVAALLRRPPPLGAGSAQGELRLTLDRAQPQRTFAEGRLRIDNMDLTWLVGKKALIERAEIVAERTGMRVSRARFGWEDQFFELSGQGRRTAQGPVVEARIESAGVALDRLLPPPDPNAPKKPSSALWPLPLSGRIEVAAAFMQYKEHRVEPFAGVLTLEPQRARLDIKEARMCGVSFPMELVAEPEHSSAAAHIRMKGEPLERTVRCLTGGTVELTGTADLSAELRTEGRRPHLLRNMTGTAQAEVREGRVKKFALLGNILAFRGLPSLGDMKEGGFPYRAMTARGRFENGEFLVDEGFFDSDAVRLAVNGKVDLMGADSRLTVLVALLSRVERLVGALPILGDVFGGTMIALPVQVGGDIRNPHVVPLGPRAVTDQLLGIFERTLKLPGKLTVPPQQEPKP
jgi:hypothetical protein